MCYVYFFPFQNAYPVSGLYSVHLLSLEALLAVIENIENHCQYRMMSENQTLQNKNLPENDLSGKDFMFILTFPNKCKVFSLGLPPLEVIFVKKEML